MWDLQSIVAENNRYALQAMMEGQRLERAQSPLPESWPLTELCQKMKIGPPLLQELITGLVDIDSLEMFLRLVRKYLPDDEEEIMSAARTQRVYRFCYIFGQKYFPLPIQASNLRMGDLAAALPVELKGMSYTAWHDPLEMRPGYLLLTSLSVYPYEGDYRDEWREELEDEDDEERPPREGTLMEIFGGHRVALIDAAQNFIGPITAQRIPSEGWLASELRQMTDGTKYDGVGDFAAWVMAETGCVVLDASYDDVEYMEGWGEPQFVWSEYNVKTLANEWPKVKEIRAKIDHIVEWMEEDPQGNFQELLEFLLNESRKLKPSKKKKTPEYDPTERWCPLDQYGNEDEYDPEAREEVGGLIL